MRNRVSSDFKKVTAAETQELLFAHDPVRFTIAGGDIQLVREIIQKALDLSDGQPAQSGMKGSVRTLAILITSDIQRSSSAVELDFQGFAVER